VANAGTAALVGVRQSFLTNFTKDKTMDCDHTRQDSWWEYDYQGIPLARVCARCIEAKLSKYRPEILEGYDQSDVDEAIDE
jgi:hypothetical protein